MKTTGKRFLAILLSLLLFVSLLPAAALAEELWDDTAENTEELYEEHCEEEPDELPPDEPEDDAEPEDTMAALFDEAVGTLCLDREYILMEAGGEPVTLSVLGLPEGLTDVVTLRWDVEDSTGEAVDSGVIAVDEFSGEITALEAGTAFVTVTVACGEIECALRCRVDVVDGSVAGALTGASLPESKATVELYRTDYTRVTVLLEMRQNLASASADAEGAAALMDNGVAVTGACFEEGSSAAEYFSLRVVDDRTLELIPTEAAFENAKKLSSCKGRIVLVGDGWTATTTETLSVTVKKTQPTIRAVAVKFNSFNPNECMALSFTGGNVLSAELDNTKKNAYWVELDGENLTLTLKEAALDKSLSGKLNLLVTAEDWQEELRVPVAVSISAAKTAPKLTLKPATLTLNPDANETAQAVASVSLPLYADSEISVSSVVLSGKSYDTAEELGLIVEVNGNTISVSLADDFDSSKAKSFTVNLAIDRAGVAVPAGKLTVKTLSGKGKVPGMTVKASGTMNLAVPGSPVTLTVTPKNYLTADYAWSFVKVVARNEEPVDAGLFEVSQQGNLLTVTENPGMGLEAGSYKVYLTADVAGQELRASAAFTVKNDQKAAPSATLKAAGTLDVIRPDSSITLTPTLKNWFGHEIAADDLVFYTGTGRNAALIENANAIPFTVSAEGGVYVLKLAPGAVIDPKTQVFSVGLRDATGTVRTASPLKLNIKMGTAKFTQSVKSVTLLRNDRFSYGEIQIAPADPTLAEIERVELAVNKNSQYFALTPLGGGAWAIRFAGDEVTVPAKTKSASLSLKVFLMGNSSDAANATLSVTVNIVNTAADGDVEQLEGARLIPASFPDANFRACLADYDLNSNGTLDKNELAAVKVLDCSGRQIASLKGIEYFTALEELNCSNNSLLTLDLRSNTALRVLNCSANTALSSCQLPATLPEISAHAFEDDAALLSLSIPLSVTKIGEYAFYGCKAMTSVTMSNDVSVIGEAAFKGCESLRSMSCS